MIHGNRFRAATLLEYVSSTSDHPLDFGVDQLKRGIVPAVEFVDFEMVCVEGDLVMAVDAGTGLGHNLKMRQEMRQEVVKVRTSSLKDSIPPMDSTLDP